MLDKAIILILGALLGALGYMLKRRFERKPTLETLDVQAKLLSISREMKEQGLTAVDLSSLERELTAKPRATQRHAEELERAARPLLEKTEGEFLSQADMNVRASNNLDVASLKMGHVLSDLTALLGETERDALSKAQSAWESYCVQQAEAASVSYRGGSIYPLIYLSEIERLTVERTARLQADLDELRRMGN